MVNGQGGIGKTTFASQYWHKYQNDYSHLAYLFVGEGILDELLQLCNTLNINFEKENLETEEKIKVLINKMANLEKPCLLILDNADSESELDKYFPLLQTCSNFHILITSRLSNYESVWIKKIKPLEKKIALKLFKDYYKYFEDSEEKDFFILYNEIDGNTLVLELFAKNLNFINQNLKERYNLAYLLSDIQNNILNLSKSFEVKSKYHSKIGFNKEKPEKIIESMYSLSKLSEYEQNVLFTLSLLPPEAINISILELFIHDENIIKYVYSLYSKGWIEYDSKSVKISPIIQSILIKKYYANFLPLINIIIQTYIDKFEFGGFYIKSNNYEEAFLLSRYSEYMLKHVNEKDERILNLHNRLGMFYGSVGNLNKAYIHFKDFNSKSLFIHQLYITDSKYLNLLSISYSRLGDYFRRVGDYSTAFKLFKKSQKIDYKLLKSKPDSLIYKNNLAKTFLKIGETHQEKENFQLALKYFRDFKRLEFEIYNSDESNAEITNNLAVSNLKIAEILISLNQLQEAEDLIYQYHILKKKLFDNDKENPTFKNGLAISFSKLGEIKLKCNNIKEARTLFKQYYSLEKELNTKHPQVQEYKNGLAYANQFLGNFYSRINKQKDSVKYFSKALKIWAELLDISPSNKEYYRNIEITKRQIIDIS